MQATVDRVIAAISKELKASGQKIQYNDLDAVVIAPDTFEESLTKILSRVLPAEVGAAIRRGVQEEVDPVRKQLQLVTHQKAQAEEKHTRASLEATHLRSKLASVQDRADGLEKVNTTRAQDLAEIKAKLREAFESSQATASSLQKLLTR